MNDRSPELPDQDALLQRLQETLKRIEWLEAENRSLRAQIVAQQDQIDANAQEMRQGNATVSSQSTQERAAAGSRIRELKKTRDSLRASEGSLRAILESATDYAIITLDLDGHVTSWNSGARNVLGWDTSEVLGRHTEFFFTPEDREIAAPQHEMQQALAVGRAEDERWHLKKDGTRFWANGLLLPFKDGELLGYLKILRDRTEQRQAEDELRRFGLIVESMSEGVSLTTADGMIVYTNP